MPSASCGNGRSGSRLLRDQCAADMDRQTGTAQRVCTLFCNPRTGEMLSIAIRSIIPGSIGSWELESLVYLFSQRTAPGHVLICSADSIVWQILGCLNKPDHGISLEELLKQLGLTKHLERQYTEDFRVHWTKRGSQDWIQGRGKKR